MSSADGVPHRGREIRLRAAVRTTIADDDDFAGLVLSVWRATEQVGFYDDMSDNPIRN